MKTLKTVSLLSFLITFSLFSFGQTKTESIPVSGNCGMCKSTIEKAAKKAGATTASWNKDTKVITLKYNSSSTNAAKIQQGIAAAGYDTRDFKADDAAYNKLHACCQYERTATTDAKHQCGEKCVMKDGKCADMAACKEKGCCKDSEECKAMGCCSESKTDSHSH